MSTPTLKEQLDQELNRIRYEQKSKDESVLNESDIKQVFDVLKKEDLELKPVLECIEKIIVQIPEENCILREQTISALLKYYNIIKNDDIMNIRHKIFFENRKLIKKPYFSQESREKIKENIQHIFRKI